MFLSGLVPRSFTRDGTFWSRWSRGDGFDAEKGLKREKFDLKESLDYKVSKVFCMETIPTSSFITVVFCPSIGKVK